MRRVGWVFVVVGLALAKSITGSVHELFRGTERVRQADFTHKIWAQAWGEIETICNRRRRRDASGLPSR